jgi:hypothetical protein
MTLLLAVVGCGDTGNGVSARGESGSSGVGGDSNTGGGVTDSATGGVGGEPSTDSGGGNMLAADSEAIAIEWFNFFAGGYRFERRLDQLSPKQLKLAEAIKVVPPTDECWADADGMSITVTSADTSREFFANAYTGTCGNDLTLVDFEAVNALLDTVHCLSAKGYNGVSAETAASIVPDDGCRHGLFNATGATPEWWFRVAIPAAGEYQVSLDACGDRNLSVDLFEDDAATAVASTLGEGACPVLTHAFAAPGSYALRIKMLSGQRAGDFYLAIESTSTQ